jgi:hypothetical protein
LTPAASSACLIASPSELVKATGFSNAMSFAPLRIAMSISGSRTPGGVQKQKTSGFTAPASSDGSVLVFTCPSLEAAAASRCGSRLQMPASSKRGLAANAEAWCTPRLPMPTTMTR